VEWGAMVGSRIIIGRGAEFTFRAGVEGKSVRLGAELFDRYSNQFFNMAK
jgi:hypothetical protein